MTSTSALLIVSALLVLAGVGLLLVQPTMKSALQGYAIGGAGLIGLGTHAAKRRRGRA